MTLLKYIFFALPFVVLSCAVIFGAVLMVWRYPFMGLTFVFIAWIKWAASYWENRK